MKQINSHYHALRVLKSVQQKFRKAIISNCDQELVICISWCVLNVSKGNIALTGCNMRKLRKHKVVLLKIVDMHVPLPGKKRLIIQHGGFFIPLLAAVLPTLASLIPAK